MSMLGSHIDVSGKRFEIEYLHQRRRTIAAYFYDGRVVIKLPISMSHERRRQAIESMEKRILRTLERMSRNGFSGLDRFDGLPRFSDGQRIRMMNREFIVSVAESAASKRSRARLSGSGNEIRVTIPAGTSPETREAHVSDLVRQALAKCMLPAVRERLDSINAAYYGFKYNGVRIRKQMRLWGSASYPQNNINLNYRLLFAPDSILDYVIAHELSHLKERNHSPRFWDLVAKAAPDHKNRRKWLRENGGRLGTQQEASPEAQQAPQHPGPATLEDDIQLRQA